MFCYFDGAELRAQAGGQASFHRLVNDFVFPSGRRCRTFDEFSQACYDEWVSARDLLREGVLRQFFGASGRTDLAKAAQDSMEQADPDIALTSFLGALPVTQAQGPKLDINPRRFILGHLLAGEHRNLELVITNQGQGMLQGTLTVTEGSDWLQLEGVSPLPQGEGLGVRGTGQHCAISAAKEQKINLRVETRGVPAGQTFGAKLTVVTNGGVVEILARMDLVAQPFPKSPLLGVKTPREMAERMRKFPKQAGPFLESGEIQRWFTSNGWNYPIQGPQTKGVAAVQQFFEAMGLSKPPPVQAAPPEVRFRCNYGEPARFQIALQTPAKKWVYGAVASDQPWLKVLTPNVSGPQQASVAFEVDPAQGNGTFLEGKLQIIANAGQKVAVRVLVEVAGGPARSWRGSGASARLRPVLAVALVFLALRLLLVPLVDFGGRSAAVRAAAARAGQPVASNSPLAEAGGWLQLPWPGILLGSSAPIPATFFLDNASPRPPGSDGVSAQEFRHYYVNYLFRTIVLWTWWIGAVLGGFIAVIRGAPADLPWGIVAGAAAGFASSATFACVFLVVECVPHLVWSVLFSGQGNAGLLFVWVLLCLLCWTVFGIVAGLVSSLFAPLRTLFLDPIHQVVASILPRRL
ncbi:MAG: hypothetical protein L0Y72_23410 [Gemmataceae bacterium]|nr:hypothetical protein [Gemmataceae bacterium]MCI0741992.1 hypothetical protein [Gemmataceae bacterium]